MNNDKVSSGSSPSSQASLSPRAGGGGNGCQFLRLADYFIVAGYSDQKSQERGVGSGVLLQRFPIEDWPDESFVETIELYQPRGWMLSSEPKEPSFSTGVMTNALGVRRFWACLCMYEKYLPSKPVDEDEDVDGTGDIGGLRFPSKGDIYAPKVLCIASRVNLTDIFRYSLATIYSAYVDRSHTRLEVLIGNLLGQVHVPPPGGPQVRFSIGRGDLQVIQPPQTPTIPVTGTTVATLLHQIGINNLLVLFSAVLTEQKILFHSRSGSRLYDACWALISIMYPFSWYHTFVPILPASIVNMVQSPTPYIIGIFSETLPNITESMDDVILVDLDGGSIFVPDVVPIPVVKAELAKLECPKLKKAGGKEGKRGKSKLANGDVKGDPTTDMSMIGVEEPAETSCSVVSRMPEVLWAQAFDQLTDILHPELSSCDHAFPPLAIKSSPPFQLDKEIRAVFLRLLANLLQGYRSCLVLLRIHPTPVIKFHQAKFLGGRGLRTNQFVVNFLNSQSFSQFVTERAPPFRPVDLWDEYYTTLESQLNEEDLDHKVVAQHLVKTVDDLSENECPNGQPYAPKILRPPDLSLVHETNSSTFPKLDGDLIDETIREGLSKQLDRYTGTSLRNQPKKVPFGPRTLRLVETRVNLVDNSARRLEVLRKCIANIFANNITVASKSIHAVKKALGSRAAKMVLCEELSRHVTSANVAMLDRQQFDLVVLLMQCALQGTSETDDEGVAAALLPLATSFCRKLCTGVIQFAYTCIQDYPVWKNPSFWEDTFYSDVQHDIVSLYKPKISSSPSVNHRQTNHAQKLSQREDTVFSALNIAAEQIRFAPTMEPEKIREQGMSDELTVYSQAMHYVNRMVYILTPLEESQQRQVKEQHFHYLANHADNVSMVASVAESDSNDMESVKEDQTFTVDVGGTVIKLVGRFVDKVASEGGVTDDHLRSLNNLIPSVVEMHLETLEGVNRQLKRLKPIPKLPIPSPQLLPGEELVLESIRAFLNIDGREVGETVGGTVSDITSNVNKSPIPAEGAIFLTNYRLIFKGNPMDHSVSIQFVVRAVPLTAITKEKWNSVIEFGSTAQEKVTIRSATSELLKVVFDEDASVEVIEAFRKALHRLRFPPDIFKYFAFSGQTNLPESPFTIQKDKNQTLKVFAKKTLMMTAKKVGVKPKGNGKKGKYGLKNWVPGSSGTLPPNTKYGQQSVMGTLSTADGDEGSVGSWSSLSEDEESLHSPASSTLTPLYRDVMTPELISCERVLDRSYAKDWKRLGFGSPPAKPTSSAVGILSKAENMRFSFANANYTVCLSYPALLVVPQALNDDVLKRLAGGYNGGRVPVVTWRHPTTKALLLRGAAMNSKGFAPRVFGQKTTGSGSEAGHLDLDCFFRSIMNATPGHFGRSGSVVGLLDSSDKGSLESLVKSSRSSMHGHPSDHMHGSLQNTPDVGRKAHKSKNAMDTLRSAASAMGTHSSKGFKNIRNWSNSVLPRKGSHATPVGKGQYLNPPSIAGLMGNPVRGDDDGGRSFYVDATRHPTLYVFIDKSKTKSWKMDSWMKVDYVPVSQGLDLSKVRTAFKGLQRAAMPSTPVQRSEDSFLKGVERCGWLKQIQLLMRHAGAVVDLVDLQGSSVMLCLGDGSDTAAQISSVAQLCLDPFYRTLEGFTILLEKEWLGFGHKFSERNNATGLEGYKHKDLITPIFIQFLDVVHQILYQYPTAFEFNHTYLKFLAYHSVSARFRTFLLDSEFERVTVGFVPLDDKRSSMKRHAEAVETVEGESAYGRPISNGQQNPVGASIFDYIAKLNSSSAVFFNFSYDKGMDAEVLRPVSNIPSLEIWDFFLEDNLGSGCPYDTELIIPPDCASTDTDSLPGDVERRRAGESGINRSLTLEQGRGEVREVVVKGFTEEFPNHPFPNAFTHRIQEINRLEGQIGLKSLGTWTWRQSDLMTTSVPLTKEVTESVVYRTLIVDSAAPSPETAKRERMAMHQQCTVSILLQGKVARGSEVSATTTHLFSKRAFTSFETCSVCSTVLFGKIGLECSQCGCCCHERCVEFMPVCIAQVFPGSEERIRPTSGSFRTTVASHAGMVNDPEATYKSFRSPAMESVTLQGFLNKRGVLLKAWRQRWFVLDTTKHELRYYESPTDNTPKGCIDLSEVKRCDFQEAGPDNQHDYGMKIVFELKTSKRIYILSAASHAEAAEWVERIQGCLI